MRLSVSDIPTVIGLIAGAMMVHIMRVDHPDVMWPFAILIGLVFGGKAFFLSYAVVVLPVWSFKLVRRHWFKSDTLIS